MNVLAKLLFLFAPAASVFTLACGSDELTKPCRPGDESCACFGDGTCKPGLGCVEGLCESNGGPPIEPKCYTPCKQGLTDEEGNYRPCSDDGLMEDCIGDAKCEEGSCVLPGEEVPACSSDAECPDFQRCLVGACYSECEADADCGDGKICERHTCRAACTASGGGCPDGQYCQVQNGEAGTCLALSPRDPESEPALVAPGSFSAAIETAALSNRAPQSPLTITNGSTHPIDLDIVKVEHRILSGKLGEPVTDDPLPWLEIGEEGDLDTEPAPLHIGPSETRTLLVDSSSPDSPDRWDGVIELRSETLGTQRISLSYAAEPTGRWSGKSYRFLQFGEVGLAAWRATKNPTTFQSVGNAFIHQWMAFVNDDIAFEELEAVITATTTESWRSPSVREACKMLKTEQSACYLYGENSGVKIYSQGTDSAPVPTAGIELPIAMNVKLSEDRKLTGRIVSDLALQYAANPQIAIELGDAANACDPRKNQHCAVRLNDLSATVVVGGRYAPALPNEEDGPPTCAGAGDDMPAFALVGTPWLVPGFDRGTRVDAGINQLIKYECRNTNDPIPPPATPADSASAGVYELANAALAAANPVPDGGARTRQLSLVDGVLIDQRRMLLIVEEHFDSFLDPSDTEGFSGYSLWVLDRDSEPLTDDDYKAEAVAEGPAATTSMTDSVMCRPDLVQAALGAGQWDLQQRSVVDRLAAVLVNGSAPSDEAPLEYSPTDVHYLCWDTGLFDRGANPSSSPKSCPRESQVTYFASEGLGDLSSLPCQQTGSCQAVLDDWRASAGFALEMNPVWRCTSDKEVYCDKDYTDLRIGKTFFQPSATAPAFVPLHNQVESAFRYKLRFQNRQGTSLGFAPSICIPGSSAVPYCYDPPTIQAISDRVDCLIDLLLTKDLGPEARAATKNYLVRNFSSEEIRDPFLGTPIVKAGFERLSAELANMLGDDAYTSAFKSRFDLAGGARAAFHGSLLEPNGIDLSGVAGYELHVLYQASQYYQMVLDRFFTLSPLLWKATQPPEAKQFVSAETAISYFDRVLLASTHKSRAFSEIARRYQSLGESGLARGVVQRAYTSAYLESIALSKMLTKVVKESENAKKPQLYKLMEQAALAYRAALLDMRDVYDGLSSDLNYFGFTNDYIPLPALEPNGPNAFETLFAQAEQSLAVAAQKEESAIASDHGFESDTQAFQAELANIRTTHENQLAELCGTFKGDDGQTYPALRRNASKSEKTNILGDPCGLIGTGEIHNAIAAYQVAGLEVEGIRAALARLAQEYKDEQERIAGQCGLTEAQKDFQYQFHTQTKHLQADIQATEYAMKQLDIANQHVAAISQISACVVGTANSCTQVPAVLGQLAAHWVSATLEYGVLEGIILAKQGDLADLQLEASLFQETIACEALKIDGAANLKRILLGVREIEIESLKKDIALRLAGSEIVRLRDRVTRILAEQQDSEQLSINAAAAKNDPNVRIFKNDAILNADRTFFEAVRATYQATKVFEYYTSQSYEALTKLRLVRLVSRGDYNLEAYLAELKDAYQEFLEEFGRPDLRVDILSLRDDILAVPYLDENGKTISHGARLRRFHAILTDPAWANGKGYLTIPFSTTLARLSPLTRNHKLSRIEAEIDGDAGDEVGRLYLSQLGAGTVRTVDDQDLFYRFPPRTAVLNPFFNGVKSLGAEVYQNFKLRDRPFANTSWELVLNQLDERANQDIDLNALNDIRIYLYYDDFTARP